MIDDSKNRRARSAVDVTRAWSQLTGLLASQAIIVGASIGVVGGIVFDGIVLAQMAFVLIGVVLAVVLFVSMSRTIQIIMGVLIKMLGQPATARDNRTGRFVPVSTTVKRDKQQYLYVDE